MIFKGRSPTMRHVSRTTLIGYLTEQFDPQDQNQTCWHQKTTRWRGNQRKLHMWWMESSFCVCSTLAISVLSIVLAAIFFQTENRVSCPTEVRKVLLKRVRHWRNRDRWVWCQGTWAHRKLLRKIRVLRTAKRIKSWVRVVFHAAAGSWRETTTKTNSTFSTAATRWHNLRAPGKWCEVMTVTSKKQGWNSTTCKSPTVDTSAPKVESRRWGTSTRLEDQCIDLVIIYVDNDESHCSSWTKLQGEIGRKKEHKLRRAQEFVRYHAENGIGSWSWNSECITDWLVNRTLSYSACRRTHIVSAHIALIPEITFFAQGNLDCMPKIFFVFRAVSHAMHSTLSTSSSTSPTITGLQRLITSRNPCADSPEPKGDGFTDAELRTNLEPERIVDNPTSTEQEIGAFYWWKSDFGLGNYMRPVLFTKKPVYSIFYWKHCYASRSRLGRRTNSCSAGLPRYLPEREARCGTITNFSLWKRRFDVEFIWKSELQSRAQGNLWHGSYIRKDWVKTRATF